MKKILKALYKIFLMPYLERGKYFQELTDDVYENDIPNILSSMGYSNEVINKIHDNDK